jgi:citrate lyase subunit beta/citryl-CoA lyase
MTAIRPRRSCLYMPGANPKALEKARALPADVVIFDLEDSVAPEAKADAREAVRGALGEGGYGKRGIVIRVNALATPWGAEDLRAAAIARPQAVLIPKVESAAELAAVRLELHRNGAPDTMALWAMVETPRAILDIDAIAGGGKAHGLSTLVMGTNDLAKEMRCAQTPDRAPFLTALSLTVLAGRAHGLTLIDGVCNDTQNGEGFADVCRQGRDLGFDGKTLIHPSQIEACNAIFAPSESAVVHARAVIAAFAAPENVGKGVIKVDGKMTELLHLDQARWTVAIADAIAELE